MSERIIEYETYRQDVWDDDPGPNWRRDAKTNEITRVSSSPDCGPWEPFAATATVAHNGMRDSLGGCVEVSGEVVWWRRARYA